MKSIKLLNYEVMKKLGIIVLESLTTKNFFEF